MNIDTIDHSERAHAEFSPSSLKYVASCAGYHGKDGSSAAAEMGTRIHEALEVFDPSALQSEEELEIYEQIVEMEKEFMRNFPTGGIEHNEIQVTVDLNGTRTWGTCDRLIIFGDRAVMADYKTGISIIDPPEKNWQAKAYTIGAFQKFPELNEITFVFYVPQHRASLAYTFERERDLYPLIDELSEIIKEGERVRPMWETGTPALSDCQPTQNCRFCRHEDYCPALGGLIVEVAKKINPQLPDIDFENTDNASDLEELWAISKIVSNWSDRFKERIMKHAKDGMQFPTLRLRSMGATKSVTDNDGLVAVAMGFGVDPAEVLASATISVSKVSKLISAKAEKGEKGKISEEFVDACENAGILKTSDTRYTLQ
jgi:hypothetical protein